jgi:hypothetical protein
MTAKDARLSRAEALMREALRNAEWCDKHIYPVSGKPFQCWKVSLYLPVPLAQDDKSPEAALDRALRGK